VTCSTVAIAMSTSTPSSARTARTPPKKSDACLGRTGISFWMYVSTPSPRKTKNAAEKLSQKLKLPKETGPKCRGS
jgi:hypothetical protein